MMNPNSTSNHTASQQTGVQGLHEVLESISDAFFALDHEWRFTYLNSAAEKLLQRKREELLLRSIWTEFPQAVGSNFEKQYRRAISERATVEFEDFYPPLEAWFSVRAYPTPSGLSVYFHNSTDARRAQQALQENNDRVREVAERLSFALEGAELGDWEWDPATDLTTLSPRAADIFGVPAEPRQKRSALRELLHAADRDRARRAAENALDRQNHYYLEYRVNRPDGKQVWVLARGHSRYDENGKVVKMAGIVQDITHRKIVEAALEDLAIKLQRQTRLFEQIATTTLDFIYIFDRDGRIVYANRRLLEVWGVPFEQAVGKSLGELGYPDWHVQMHLREIKQVIDTKQPIKGVVPFTGGSGISGVYEYIFTPVLDDAGNVEVIAGTTRDVTDRQRSEQDAEQAKSVLENSLARWQAAVENMTEGIVLVDPNANILEMNPAALEIHGYKDAADIRVPLGAIAQSFTIEHIDGSVVPFEQWPIPKLLRGESFRNLELRLLRSDQKTERIISYSGSPIRDRDGHITVVLLTLHDVTEERRFQRTLHESEARFREVFDQTPIGLTLTDTNGRYLHVNPAYSRIVGYTFDELLAPTLDFRNLIHPEDRPKMLALQKQLLAGEIPAFFLEKRYVRRDGTQVWVRVTGTVRRDSESGAMQFVRLVEDIDDRKRAEAELADLLDSERAARSEAERVSRMKDEFLATLSHELRTPLNAILGWSQLLASSTTNATDLAEGLTTIERNARAQAQIIEDLLDMSRIISGKIRLDVQQLDLAAIVKTSADSIKPTAENKGVRLLVVIDPHAGPVKGDPARLQQVMWNLLTNAVKFTPRGGRVQVLLERINSHLEVSVIDTGEGISADFLPHVFDRFRQSDASTTRRHGGLGLGLAIVKQLVELHGGTIRAKSPGLGGGSIFTVALPLMPAHADPSDSPERRHPKQHGPVLAADACATVAGVHVLVVDDEPDARALMKRLLEACDAKVSLAASAEEAFQIIQRDRPDVLVSDIGMPIEDGYSLLRRIRALPADQGGRTPAVALTAYARAEDRMKAVLAGFQHHVAKPVEPAELITMVSSLIRRER